MSTSGEDVMVDFVGLVRVELLCAESLLMPELRLDDEETRLAVNVEITG